MIEHKWQFSSRLQRLIDNHIGAITVSDLVESLPYWRQDGLTPLGHIKGYVELLLEGEMGILTDTQRKVIEAIGHCCYETIQSWYDLSDHFRLYASEEIASPTKFSDEGPSHPRDHIFKALASLQKIHEHVELFLKEEWGPTTTEQRAAIDAINRLCDKARVPWHHLSRRPIII